MEFIDYLAFTDSRPWQIFNEKYEQDIEHAEKVLDDCIDNWKATKGMFDLIKRYCRTHIDGIGQVREYTNYMMYSIEQAESEISRILKDPVPVRVGNYYRRCFHLLRKIKTDLGLIHDHLTLYNDSVNELWQE